LEGLMRQSYHWSENEEIEEILFAGVWCQRSAS
jgi:hypothetical protein